MIETINIRGDDYKINDFSNLHLGLISKFLMDVSTFAFDVKAQNEVSYILKEVILPDLPDNLVKKIGDGQYILLLDIDEVSNINTVLSKYFADKRLAEAKARSDEAAIAKYQKMVTDLEKGGGGELDELEELRSQIEELKSLSQQKTEEEDEITRLKKELAQLKQNK